jgi:Polyketide cyclase / dehydrase and lipid transport
VSVQTRVFFAVLLLAALAAAGVALSGRGVYGLTLFVLIPLFVGGVASWTNRPQTGKAAAKIGAITTAISASALLILGVEGILCIVMALPLAVPLGAFGAWLVYRAEASSPVAGRGIAMLLLLPSASMTWDLNARPPVFEVRSSVEIAAAPEQVWKHLVAFTEMPEPKEWYFRAGLAFPTRARIVGSGVTAVRYCDFSTGPVVEPIKVWDEPRVLRFGVTESPAPMREWSPYPRVTPKHLHGYLVSREGQFVLKELANHHTLLEGTSWYQHGLWPAEYWRWWSDAIIHRIHKRVLNHIRTLAEQDASWSNSPNSR